MKIEIPGALLNVRFQILLVQNYPIYRGVLPVTLNC